jgi:hypothetical protein
MALRMVRSFRAQAVVARFGGFPADWSRLGKAWKIGSRPDPMTAARSKGGAEVGAAAPEPVFVAGQTGDRSAVYLAQVGQAGGQIGQTAAILIGWRGRFGRHHWPQPGQKRCIQRVGFPVNRVKCRSCRGFSRA